MPVFSAWQRQGNTEAVCYLRLDSESARKVKIPAIPAKSLHQFTAINQPGVTSTSHLAIHLLSQSY